MRRTLDPHPDSPHPVYLPRAARAKEEGEDDERPLGERGDGRRRREVNPNADGIDIPEFWYKHIAAQNLKSHAKRVRIDLFRCPCRSPEVRWRPERIFSRPAKWGGEVKKR